MDETLRASRITKKHASLDKRLPGGVTIPAGSPYWIGEIIIEGRECLVYGTSLKECRERLIEMIRSCIGDIESDLNNLNQDLSLLLTTDNEED